MKTGKSLVGPVILAAGLVIGVVADTLSRIGLYAYAVGVVINVVVLARIAAASGRLSRLPVALLGVAFAGLWEGIWITIVAFTVWVIVGWLR